MLVLVLALYAKAYPMYINFMHKSWSRCGSQMFGFRQQLYMLAAKFSELKAARPNDVV